ncbi:MAG TPA: M14 family metallopeptidase [Candidatus Krumholzibacterium sp.]|nr:M14 family metallopeptidase [Candidatus Krumholzibacterium sp.]
MNKRSVLFFMEHRATRPAVVILAFLIAMVPIILARPASCSAQSGEEAAPLTTAERTGYAETTLYPEIMEFLHAVARSSSMVRVVEFCESTEGRSIPLVVLSTGGIGSPYELAMSGKDCVLIQANIHAGEVEGKEACLMLVREIGNGRLAGFLENQVILVIPDLNADGNEKLSEDNRRDNGPRLAGERVNGQNLDLNRDYPKLESPEISALVRLFNRWDPVLFVDMHAKNGSYIRTPVTYTTVLHPDAHPAIGDYMWKKMFPKVEKTMKKEHGFEAMPYGNFSDRLDPRKGWLNHAIAGRYGSNYFGLRNRFSILDENYPHADFRTRVLASYAFIQSILAYTNDHIGEMREIAEAADRETTAAFHADSLTLEDSTGVLCELVVKSYAFVNEKIPEEDLDKYPPWWDGIVVNRTDEEKDYRVPYYSKSVPTRKIDLPEGYVILPYQEEIVGGLLRQGISVSRIERAVSLPLSRFVLREVRPSDEIFQGHVFVEVEGEYVGETVDVPAGAFYVSLRQPLARLAAILLEPQSEDSYLRWGILNRIIIRQWGRNRPNVYPVFRADGVEDRLDLIGLDGHEI